MSVDEDVIGYLGSLGAQQLRAVVDEEGGVSLLDGDGELLLDDSIGSAEAAAVALRGVAGVLLARAVELERRARAPQHWT